MYRYYVLILGILTGLILGQGDVLAGIPVGGSVTGPEGLPFPEARVVLLPELDPVAAALRIRSGEPQEPVAAAPEPEQQGEPLDAKHPTPPPEGDQPMATDGDTGEKPASAESITSDEMQLASLSTLNFPIPFR